MQKDIKQSWFFNQSPREVWKYLTQPELMELWLMKSDFQPVVGHKFRFTHVPKNDSSYEGYVDCEVLEVNPVTSLSYTWQGRIRDGGRIFNSTVLWTLVPNEKGTELRLFHNGFTEMEDVNTHSAGWNKCIERMEGLFKQTNHAHANT